MTNFECKVTIADIYGAEWWERNREQLDREWEWEFALAGAVKVAHVAVPDIQEFSWYMLDGRTAPRIILHRRKPRIPTLREVYGVDEVTIPQGWEWTGEWRVPVNGDYVINRHGDLDRCDRCDGSIRTPRLILRERPKKVWFKAEETHRASNPGDWAWVIDRWKLVGIDTLKPFTLCATRHEEVDSTAQVVTQAMVDGVAK